MKASKKERVLPNARGPHQHVTSSREHRWAQPRFNRCLSHLGLKLSISSDNRSFQAALTTILIMLLYRHVQFFHIRTLRLKTPASYALLPHRSCRYASTSPSKPRVLEKPTKFNPPSHGKRLKERMPRIYGPEITYEQRKEQGKSYYPNMMPPEGTFMHWFLMNRSIHLWIILVRRACGLETPIDQAYTTY